MRQRIPLFIVAGLAGLLFDWLHAPVAWLLGPMLAGIALSGLWSGPQPLPPGYQALGQTLIGLYTGTTLPLVTLKSTATYAVPLLAAVLLTAGASLYVGHLIWRWGGIARATSYMGMLPGAASSMVAMADELGADPVLVAVMQYLRMLIVSFLTPLALRGIFPATASASQAAAQMGAPPMPPGWNLPVLVAAALVGVLGGRRIKLPTPAFLGPFLAALLLSWTLPYQIHVPMAVYAGGMLLLGVSIGARFDLPAARRLGRAAVIEAVGVLALMLFATGAGYLFHLLTGVAPVTAVLGSTPGGMETMVATTVELGGDTGTVMAMQMVRWFAILLFGPWVARRLAGKNDPRGGMNDENGGSPARTAAVGGDHDHHIGRGRL